MKSSSRSAPIQAAAPASRLARTFFDSNILIYAEDPRDPRKQQKALEIISAHARQRSGVVSVQVLGEYFHTVTRKLILDPSVARAQVKFYSLFQVVEPVVADVFGAIDLYRLHTLSYWDALIVHSAKQAGCSQLLSENMHHSQVIDGVRIVNPFL